jgi:hypothetical protein
MAEPKSLEPQQPERMTEVVELGRSTGLVGEGQTDQVATSRIQPATQIQSQAVDPKNPLGEEMVNVRVRPGVDTNWDGERVRGGDEFKTPISKARAGSMYVDEVLEDGQVRPIQHEQQRGVEGIPLAQIAGLARHERIEALTNEKKALEERLKKVDQQLKHEEEGEKREADERQRKAAQPSPTPSYQPGTPGAPATASTPPRPGEPGAQTPTGTIPGRDLTPPKAGDKR